MKSKYIVGVDAGTMGARSVIYDIQGNEMGSAYHETPTTYPRPGWLEQKAEDIVRLAHQSTGEAIKKSGIDPKDIVAVSFTNMRSTFVPVDKNGKYLSHVYMWQDLRGTEMFPWMREQLAKNGMTEMDLYNLSGFPIGPTWPSSKVYWFKKHYPELYDKTYKFIMPQALLSKAYGADDFCEDLDDAGWWQITNADTFEYDPKLARIFEVDIEKYPKNYRPGTPVGKVPADVAAKTGLPVGTPVVVGSGDQQCGAIGLGNAKDGMASVCLGTAGLCIGCSSKPIRHPGGTMYVLGHPGPGHWQMEGQSNAAASSFRWLRNTLCQMEMATSDLSGIEVYDVLTHEAAQSAPGAHGTIFLPFLSGANSPYYDSYARAVLLGMTFAHKKSDMVRGAMEGICYEMRDMLDSLKEASFKPFESYRITGGAARSSLWNQIQADIYGKPVETVKVPEATALGAAMLGAVGVGIYKDLYEAIDNMVHVDNRWEPIAKNVAVYDELFSIYRDTYKALKEKVFPAISRYQGVVEGDGAKPEEKETEKPVEALA